MARYKKALSRSLEGQIVALASRAFPYGVAANPVPASQAPDTLQELCKATKAGTRDQNGRQVIPVYEGHSGRTIWSSAEVNWLFRAWHDSHHILLSAEFNEAGELAAARYACSQVHGKPERAILWAELAGQVLYHKAHGHFPHDQRQFVRDCVRFGVQTTVDRGVYHREAL